MVRFWKKKEGGDDPNAEPETGEAVDPFAEDRGDQAWMGMQAGMAPMFADARMGYFVEIDGQIVETNALHRKDNLITIMRVDLGKVFANAESMQKLDRLEKLDAVEAQQLVDQIDGFDADFQQPITVRFD